MVQPRKLILTGILGLGIAAGIYAGQAVIISKADGAVQPGSADDPLVTKSYLDEQLKKLTGGQWTAPSTTPTQTGTNTGTGVSEQRVNELIAAEVAKAKQELLSQLNTSGGTSTQPAQPTPTLPAGTAQLEVIKLEAGQILYGGIGSEIIVRTGKTIAVSNDDGIPDVTAGKDIAAGAAIENNHLLVIPHEGRGVKADPKNKDEIYIMIRGSYLLLKEGGAKTTP
ncbi:hypothetical protein [Paenibacillus ginsengarvi]|uniref:Uncharacterized protein n=1 Tax=Paenibacillus ginsengarvi TaxID=400777 RepID=A0A3B0BYU9_9BACL|nr:hypothetical protein [Paenibacillus ginsengarvi]RKN78865.1 hypothetical protein D7M11_22585 [Paenibacillus ginsengarvi]